MEKIGFSIIVPALHESDTINSLIEHLERLEYDAGREIIVVDGSPDMDTIQAIGKKSVIKIVAPKGRARQMNMGASVANGEILVFLHADTELPRNALVEIDSAMTQGYYIGGSFELDIKSERFRFKLLSRLASIRCHLTRIPYGDQAIFIKRDYFNTIGGYREMPLMEDVELMRRIKRRGDKICILRDRVMTSPRRWEQEGFIYANLRNAAIFTMYLLGVSPEKLASFYKDTRKQSKG